MPDDPLQTLRRICLALPEASERISHGQPSWYIRGRKTFAMYVDHRHVDHGQDDRPGFWCPAPPGAQEEVVAEEPARFFRPPYVGHRGWLGVYLDMEVDWDEIRAIVTEAYRTVAPKKLVAELDEAVGRNHIGQ